MHRKHKRIYEGTLRSFEKAFCTHCTIYLVLSNEKWAPGAPCMGLCVPIKEGWPKTGCAGCACLISTTCCAGCTGCAGCDGCDGCDGCAGCDGCTCRSGWYGLGCWPATKGLCGGFMGLVWTAEGASLMGLAWTAEGGSLMGLAWTAAGDALVMTLANARGAGARRGIVHAVEI